MAMFASIAVQSKSGPLCIARNYQRLFHITAMSSSTSTSIDASSNSASFPITASIREKLTKEFQPLHHLEVINESHMHKVPPNSETHFKVVVVSERFDSVPNLLQRHRLIHATLEEELKPGAVHALSIVAKSPSQWQALMDKGEAISPSPRCRGGDGTFAKE
jgi:stress-induced morphogen